MSDAPGGLRRVDEDWIRQRVEAYCDVTDMSLLKRILPPFDQETADFYRWQVRYSSEELAALIRARTGIDLGPEIRLTPIRRGASGRIVVLRIDGPRGALTVGKELEVRRVLSPSHLYSSAFVVDAGERGISLSGAGWGHGVGLCQIGAGVMAEAGASYREILGHYYPGSRVERQSAARIEK